MVLLIFLLVAPFQGLLFLFSFTWWWNAEDKLFVGSTSKFEAMVASLAFDGLLASDDLRSKAMVTYLAIQIEIASEGVFLVVIIDKHGDLEWLVLLYTNVALLLRSHKLSEGSLYFGVQDGYL